MAVGQKMVYQFYLRYTCKLHACTAWNPRGGLCNTQSPECKSPDVYIHSLIAMCFEFGIHYITCEQICSPCTAQWTVSSSGLTSAVAKISLPLKICTYLSYIAQQFGIYAGKVIPWCQNNLNKRPPTCRAYDTRNHLPTIINMNMSTSNIPFRLLHHRYRLRPRRLGFSSLKWPLHRTHSPYMYPFKDFPQRGHC